jgi:hypothetical protein
MRTTFSPLTPAESTARAAFEEKGHLALQVSPLPQPPLAWHPARQASLGCQPPLAPDQAPLPSQAWRRQEVPARRRPQRRCCLIWRVRRARVRRLRAGPSRGAARCAAARLPAAAWPPPRSPAALPRAPARHSGSLPFEQHKTLLAGAFRWSYMHRRLRLVSCTILELVGHPFIMPPQAANHQAFDQAARPPFKSIPSSMQHAC